MYFLLFYNYVENAAEKRAPYREDHLALVRKYVELEKLALAGAFADTLDGAVLVFKTDTRDDVNAFIEQDPYVRHHIVTQSRVREWNVVAGSLL